MESESSRHTGTPSWSNVTCRQIAFKNNFPKCVNDLNVQKIIVNRFLDFYLGKKTTKGLNVTDIVFSTIAIMPRHAETEQFIWGSEHYQEDGTLFFLTPGESLKTEMEDFKDITTRPEEAETDTLIKENIAAPDYERNAEKNQESTNEVNTDEKVTSKKDDDENIQRLCKGKADTHKNVEEPTSNISGTVKMPDVKNAHFPRGTKNVPRLPSDMRWYYRNSISKVTENITHTFGPLENSAFVASCNKLLNEWETNSKGRIVLKYFFGIIAMILMRTTTKKQPHLVSTLSSSKFLSVISFIDGFIKYCTPQRKCYRNSFKTFRKRDGNIPTMFAKIIINSFEIDVMRKNRPRGSNPKLNILKLALLAHTADYGFGLVGMIQNLETKLGIAAVNKIVEATYCEETEKSWERVRRFLEKYMVTWSSETTHHWARVINIDYFKDMSCNANFELSVILAVFIEKVTNNADIWKSSWVATGINLEEFKKIGLKMYESIDLNENSARKSNSDMNNERKEQRQQFIDIEKDKLDFNEIDTHRDEVQDFNDIDLHDDVEQDFNDIDLHDDYVPDFNDIDLHDDYVPDFNDIDLHDDYVPDFNECNTHNYEFDFNDF